MEPSFVELDEIFVVGMCLHVTPDRIPEIAKLWERFIPKTGEIDGLSDGKCYGVSFCQGDGFFYMAGMPVASLASIPPAFVGKSIPAGRYASWTHKGPITEFGKTMERVFQEWLPASGLKPLPLPTIECYEQERFNPEDGETDIWIPVAG